MNIKRNETYFGYKRIIRLKDRQGKRSLEDQDLSSLALKKILNVTKNMYLKTAQVFQCDLNHWFDHIDPQILVKHTKICPILKLDLWPHCSSNQRPKTILLKPNLFQKFDLLDFFVKS